MNSDDFLEKGLALDSLSKDLFSNQVKKNAML